MSQNPNTIFHPVNGLPKCPSTVIQLHVVTFNEVLIFVFILKNTFLVKNSYLILVAVHGWRGEN